MENIKFLIHGDSAVAIEFGKKIDPKINRLIMKNKLIIEKELFEYIDEIIPTYTTLLINYKVDKILFSDFKKKLIYLINENISSKSILPENKKTLNIPVYYDGADINFVAEYNNISVEKLIEIHTKDRYLIYMLGFTPGFLYLGGIDKKINCPRLKEPRIKVKAGSVGIAGNQTGIYPVDSPGGWQIIGRTPIKLFLKDEKNPFLVESGDYIKFNKIDLEEYKCIENLLIEKKYIYDYSYLGEEQWE